MPAPSVRAICCQLIVHKPAERPDVEVLVDGTWCPGELGMSTQLDDGSWEFNVQWRPPGTDTKRVDTFAGWEVRRTPWIAPPAATSVAGTSRRGALTGYVQSSAARLV